MTRKDNRNASARRGFPAAILITLALAVLACSSVVSAAAQATSPIWTPQGELTAPDAGGAFGRSVAVYGNIAVVGVPNAMVGAGSEQGAAWIFVNNGGVWTEQAELTAADGVPFDGFGSSVAVFADTVVVGAPLHQNSSGSGGTAYVFVNNGGTWVQSVELIAPDGGPHNQFGYSLSFDGFTVVVGDPTMVFNGSQTGAAYVFSGLNNGGVLTEQTELVAADGQNGDEFGASVSVSSGNILVGAPYKTINNSFPAQGIVYVFTNNPVWTQYRELIAPDGAAGSGFGYSVSLSGMTAAIGAPGGVGLGGPATAGSLYIWQESFGYWTNSAELQASDASPGDWFGASVSLDDVYGRLAVGAPNKAFNSSAPGAAYAFALIGGTWTEQTELTGADSASSDAFGISVGASGMTILVGAPIHRTNSTFGAAYVYTEAPTQLQITQQPAVGTAGSGIDAVLVRVFDAVGNPLFTSGVPVTLASSPAGVSGALTVNTANGVAEFDGLSFGASGSYTLTASAPGLTSGTSAPIQISPVPQTITFGALSSQTLGSAPLAVAASASSGLPVSFASLTTPVCTVSGSMVSLLATGTCTLEASQAGDTTYSAAAPIDQSFQVTQAPLQPQTITFGALSNQTLGTTPFAVTANASSGLPVSLASLTTPVCTVSGNTVTLVATGQCTLQAAQAGNATYAAATPVSQSFQVTPAPLQSQTITFGALSNQTLGSAPFAVTANASSGLPVSFTSLTTPVCTASGNTVSLVATGQCTLQATQAGNSTYAAATPVSQSFQVNPAPLQPQTITFGALSNQTLGSAPFAVTASASSGLPVSLASLTTPVCTVSGNTVTLVATGQCTVQATQAGNSTYSAATPVNRSFQVTPAPLQPQTITFGALSNQTLGSAPFAVTASASSGLPVSFTSLTTSVCTVAGNTVSLVATGQCTVQATQAGNSTYSAATPVNRSFQVTPVVKPKAQTIIFAPLPDRKMGVVPFTITATASSGLPVVFTSLSASVCSVNTNVVTLLSAGICSIQASQPGNSAWQPATPVTRSFTVSLRNQTIVFPPITMNFSPAPVLVNADATSGLPVTLKSNTDKICKVVDGTHYIRTLSPGTCRLTATQDGDGEYLPATPVTQSFVIGKGTQTITFGPIPNQTLPPLAKQGNPVPLVATSTSMLSVDFRSLTPGTCVVSKAAVTDAYTVIPVRLGTCTVEAYQLESANYLRATPVDQSFHITQ